jgi:hypothetical protein
LKKIRIQVYALTGDELSQAVAEFTAKRIGFSGRYAANVRIDTVELETERSTVCMVSLVPENEDAILITTEDVQTAIDRVTPASFH